MIVVLSTAWPGVGDAVAHEPARIWMRGLAVLAASAKGKDIMDDRGFDNIARRLGAIQSRRSAFKIAGSGAAGAVLAALGLESSALAGDLGATNHCLVRGSSCEKRKQCCGYRRKSRREIVCKSSSAGPGLRCCGQSKASCVDTTDCCDLYECNQSTLKCQRI